MTPIEKPDALEAETSAPSVPGRLFSVLTTALNALGSLGIVLLMFLINADIAGRVLFNTPIRGVPEIVSLSIVSIVFLQAGYMLRSGRMISSDSLIDRLRSTRPTIACYVESLFNGAGALLFGALFFASMPPFLEAWNEDLFIGAIGDFTVPVWPMKLVVLIGSAMLTLQYLIFVASNLRSTSARVEAIGGAHE